MLVFSQVGFGGHARHVGEVKSRNDLHSICFQSHLLFHQTCERTARCRWWSQTIRSSGMAVAPRDARQHPDVALARRHARAPQGADGAAHATNRFLHGLNAPISRVGEPEQWSHEPMPAVAGQSGRRLRLQCRCSRRTICRWTPRRTASSRSGTRSPPA